MILAKVKYHQGYFKPRNPEKYIGNSTDIIFRSGWECSYMSQLDRNPNVIGWSSESHIIPYISPKDNKYHRYFSDMFVKEKQPDGSIVKYIIEIKPEVQCKPPKIGNKKKKTLLIETITFAVNQAKWEAAREYCKKRGYIFKIITEKDLKILL